jgi:hypothetical protein
LDHKPNVDKPEQKESGIWRPTAAAGRFLEGRESAPLHVYTYNKKVLARGAEMVFVSDIVKGFDYHEMMRSS